MLRVFFREANFPSACFRVTHTLIVRYAGGEPRKWFHHLIHTIQNSHRKERVIPATCQTPFVHFLDDGLFHLGVTKPPVLSSKLRNPAAVCALRSIGIFLVPVHIGGSIKRDEAAV